MWGLVSVLPVLGLTKRRCSLILVEGTGKEGRTRIEGVKMRHCTVLTGLDVSGFETGQAILEAWEGRVEARLFFKGHLWGNDHLLKMITCDLPLSMVGFGALLAEMGGSIWETTHPSS
jgi:surface protein